MEIGRRLSTRSWTEIDLVLEEFGGQTSYSWSGDQFSYVVAMLRSISDDMLRQLAEHENIYMGEDSVLDAPAFWKEGQLRVFLSHISAHKIFASELQGALASFGICAFVAHEDIEPTAEWQDEIEKALRSCDALVALLNPKFNESTWTDQEVGYGLGRGIPVFSIRLGMSPYGLFGRKQAFNGNGKTAADIARELFETYRSHPKTSERIADALIAKLGASASFAEAKANCALVETVAAWKPDYKKRLRQIVEQNDQVKAAWGVPQRIEALIAARDPDPAREPASSTDDEVPF
jgi:hypothetical protein